MQHENRFQMGDSGRTLLAWGKKVPHNLEGRGEEVGVGGRKGSLLLGRRQRLPVTQREREIHGDANQNKVVQISSSGSSLFKGI